MAAGGTAIELTPAKVARQRFEADLVLDQCTLTSERTIVRAAIVARTRAGAGPTLADHFADTARFLSSSSGRSRRETVLLRCDGDALASGTRLLAGQR